MRYRGLPPHPRTVPNSQNTTHAYLRRRGVLHEISDEAPTAAGLFGRQPIQGVDLPRGSRKFTLR